MHYSFKKTVYMDGDGRKNSYPSVVIEDSEKYGSFFQDEINHLSLDYVEEIFGEIEAVLNGEVDFYEGFGFEVYMIECDREKAVVKNVYEDDRVEAIIPIEEVYELMRDWRDFQREYYHNPTSSQKWQGIELPEFTITRGLGVSIEDGTEIWKITRDGKQTLYAVFEEVKFTVLK